MSQAFIGEIKMFAGTFAPRGYAFCNGQLMSIASNTALFSILGTTYGGNGVQTFGLPDLRGRSPIHWGQGPGLSDMTLGETGGVENVTLISTQMPAHAHAATGGTGTITLPCSTKLGDSDSPVGRVPAISPGGEEQFIGVADANAQTAPLTVTTPAPVIAPAGGSQPHENRPPFLAVTFIIALQGIFPSRN